LGTYSVSVREGILCLVAWLASFYPHNNPVKLTLLLFSPPYKWGNPGEEKQSNLLKVSLIVRVNRDYSVIGCLPDSRGRAPPSTIACPLLLGDVGGHWQHSSVSGLEPAGEGILVLLQYSDVYFEVGGWRLRVNTFRVLGQRRTLTPILSCLA